MIKVMVIDDSPLVRKIASDILNIDPEIEVIATASSAEIALRRLESMKPDVITMDIEMPGMGGLAATKKIMSENPIPIIILSAFAKHGAELTLQALDNGAVDFIAKPEDSLSGGIGAIAKELIEKVKHVVKIRVGKIESGLTDRISEEDSVSEKRRPFNKSASLKETSDWDIIAIGTSTGGPVALKTVLRGFPEDLPVGIVVVQHMPPVFTKAFADRLNSICSIEVKEAQDGDLILPGRALIAPGDFHMTVTQYNTRPKIMLHKWAPVSGHRPSVDVLMHSIAREYAQRAIAVIMTGMGKDGSEGIAELKDKGGYIVAQDQESSVIFGMNREVIRNGDADEIVPVERIPKAILERVSIKQKV